VSPSDSKTGEVKKYPMKRKCPKRNDRTTWRDFMLESALVYTTTKTKCRHN